MDILIIGTGAGGGTLAHAMASTGQCVLLLERGDSLPREKANWDPRTVFVDQRYRATEVWYDGSGRSYRPEVHYYVGGNTKVYGAALLRMREQDFAEVQTYDGLSPAWPMSYRDFEPFYITAERLYMVHGRHGDDPLDPPASAEYAFPPMDHEPRIQQLVDDLRKVGLHPFSLPMAQGKEGGPLPGLHRGFATSKTLGRGGHRTPEESVLHRRLAVMQRAAALGNVSQACREFRISRTLFYRWRKRFTRYGPDGLRSRPAAARALAAAGPAGPGAPGHRLRPALADARTGPQRGPAAVSAPVLNSPYIKFQQSSSTSGVE